MTLKLFGNQLFTSSGEFLKTIACPKNVDTDSLKPDGDGNYVCKMCTHKIFNTDEMSELELVNLLRRHPGACLSINLANPLFEHSQRAATKKDSDNEN